MAGHSKWANIQHRKGRQDKQRGKAFTRLGKELMIAARIGGGNVDFNPRLRLAIDKAKAANMPKDTIERAIKKGTWEDKSAAAIQEVVYEWYAPGWVAVMVTTLTDNKNRTVSSIRHTFTKYWWNLWENWVVSWMFHRK